MAASRPPQRTPLTVLGAVGLAVALIPLAWFALGLLFIGGMVNAARPDPDLMDGDPCCGYPDTWGEVGGGFAFSLVMGVVVAVALFGIVMLLRWALTARWPDNRRSWWIAAAIGAAMTSIGYAWSLESSLAARQETDCGTFSLRPDRLRSSDRDTRRAEAYGLADCGFASDLQADEVRALLGPPRKVGHLGRDSELWLYRDVEVQFLDAVAVDVQIYPYEGGDPWQGDPYAGG